MLNINFRMKAARRGLMLFSSCAIVIALSACMTDGSGSNFKSSDKGQPYQSSQASAAKPATERKLPTLVVTNDPPPDVIYRRGSRDTVLSEGASRPAGYPVNTENVETLVTRKVSDLSRDLASISRDTETFSARLKTLQAKSDASATKYYELVAGINTELQSGTTPGNPILVERWNAAQEHLEALSQSAAFLNDLAADLTDEATRASFLQENVRAAYGLSGAVKEDHQKLHVLEDNVNQNIVAINRLLTQVSDEINRRGAYLRSERLNMTTLSLAIANGELYGQNLANTMFKKAAESGQALYNAQPGSSVDNGADLEQRRPLVIIRFDRPNVNYEQALYSAVGQALEKYPSAKFDLVAVGPTEGNAAQLALASTESRKNGEAVLRSLTQMGLPIERVNLSAANSRDVQNSEVHIYIQ